MEVVKTPIFGVLLIKPKIFGDERGLFVETWQDHRYRQWGIGPQFVQDNFSTSTRNVLRGIHFQVEHPQGKLVRVTVGEIFDVAVDIRPSSPTFGKWYGAYLSAKNQHQLWIAPGLAHGFFAISEEAHFHYKCTEYYHSEDEDSIVWNDPTLKIRWPDAVPILSEKDSKAQTFQEWKLKNALY